MNIIEREVNLDYSISFEELQFEDLFNKKIHPDSTIMSNEFKLLLDKYDAQDFFKKTNYLEIHIKFSCNWNWERLTYISYQEVQDSIKSPIKIFKVGLDSELDKIMNLVLKLPLQSFREFYYKSENPDFKQINKYKKLVRSPANNLDIFKLAAVLEKHPELLSQKE